MSTCASPVPYFGGKALLAARIVELFPVHGHYVEPYCGSLAVLLAKAPSAMETVNDLDARLMTFWRVLREQPAALARAVALTPHSRAEFDSCDEVAGCDDLEVARRVHVQLTQGRGAVGVRSGWRHYIARQAPPACRTTCAAISTGSPRPRSGCSTSAWSPGPRSR